MRGWYIEMLGIGDGPIKNDIRSFMWEGNDCPHQFMLRRCLCESCVRDKPNKHQHISSHDDEFAMLMGLISFKVCSGELKPKQLTPEVLDELSDSCQNMPHAMYERMMGALRLIVHDEPLAKLVEGQ